jgi:hypothetical protein
MPVLGRALAMGFEGVDSEHFVALFPPEAKRGVTRSANVVLPARAKDAVSVEDESTKLRVHFTLRDVRESSASADGGMVVYEGALDGADVVFRVHAEGMEDYVAFESRPRVEEIVYDVDVTQVAGLRLVSNTLEFLDDGGAPVLRVAPPYIIDGRGERTQAWLRVEGCRYDENPAAPWGRPVTRAGAARCALHVAWHVDAYPALLDPNWSTTGSMAVARYLHTATLLSTGNVLVAGGVESISSAELYNTTEGTFSATGSMATGRYRHTATLLSTGNVLVAGGYHIGGASAELYDPGAGTFSVTGSMSASR